MSLLNHACAVAGAAALSLYMGVATTVVLYSEHVSDNITPIREEKAAAELRIGELELKVDERWQLIKEASRIGNVETPESAAEYCGAGPEGNPYEAVIANPMCRDAAKIAELRDSLPEFQERLDAVPGPNHIRNIGAGLSMGVLVAAVCYGLAGAPGLPRPRRLQRAIERIN